VGLRKKLNITAITAMISKICIKLPSAIKKNPMAHPMIRITAMVYNIEFMMDLF
jgi:hypothetical protein